MNIGSSPRGHWPAIICAVVVLLIVFGLLGTCRSGPDVNTELARATRVAVESAEAAHRNNDAAYLWPGRLRMLALAVGVTVPVVAAVVLVWICLRHRPSDLELSGYLDRQCRALGLPEARILPGDRSQADLPAPNPERNPSMHETCQNPNCESPSFKEVPISVEAPGDQVRSLCVVCEEAYGWGVQHGLLSSTPGHVDAFLAGNGFIVLTGNTGDPSEDGPFEAWAYRGPLDFAVARPVRFGVGGGSPEALRALDGYLARFVDVDVEADVEAGEVTGVRHVPVFVDARELATILAALRLHQDENLQGDDRIPDEVIRQIATNGGVLTPLDGDEISGLCERINLQAGPESVPQPEKGEAHGERQRQPE